jgi:hypothetical protein
MLDGMSSSTMPYPLRMSEQLRTLLKEQARQHDQSLHAEIIEILQGAVEDPASYTPRGVDVDALAEALAPKLAAKLKEQNT